MNSLLIFKYLCNIIFLLIFTFRDLFLIKEPYEVLFSIVEFEIIKFDILPLIFIKSLLVMQLVIFTFSIFKVFPYIHELNVIIEALSSSPLHKILSNKQSLNKTELYVISIKEFELVFISVKVTFEN